MTYTPSLPAVRFPQKQLILPGDAVAFPSNILTNAGAGLANMAFYQPFVMPCTCTLLKMAFSCSTGTNSHDMGIYQGTTRLTSRGPTASTAAAVNEWTLGTPIVLQEGVLYFAAWATAGTSTIARHAGTSWSNPRLGRMIQSGLTSNTLPNPAVFSPPAADAHVPILRLTFQD